MTHMMNTKLKAHSRRIEANQSNIITAIYHLSQQIKPTNQPSQFPPSQSIISSPVQATTTTVWQEIRVEEVRFFDPEYQQEQGFTGPVINTGKHVFYRDVYVFVNRLKDLAAHRDGVKQVINACFRGSALM